MRLVLIGAPGSGKGTQAARLAGRFGVPIISSGELLRSRAADGSELGREVAAFLDRGELVPDDLALAVVRDAVVERGAGGFILDGFPRTVEQAERAEDIPELVPDHIVSLRLSDAEARQRLSARDEGRSDDASREVIDRRLQIFHAQTEPLLDFYRQRSILDTVDADSTVEAVTDAILAVLASA